MSLYVDCILRIKAAHLQWIADTNQPWTWERYGVDNALTTIIFRYARKEHA